MFRTFLRIPVVACALAAAPALAGFSLGLQGGLVRHEPKRSGSAFAGSTTGARNGFLGRGYMAAGPAAFQVEGGATFGERAWTSTTGGATTENSYSHLGVDLLGRFRFPFLSIGAGGYWSAILGTITEKTGGTTRFVKPTDAGHKFFDYGLVGSARLELAVGKRFAFTLDGRYLFGLHNLWVRDGGTSRTREIQGLVGGHFDF